ncbi:DUF4037 domain-containing protein [Cellulomonas cellasea]|uniref:DUF4037 domain-containing protein n=2 Tax=Cellulomonas cellasea TaxID=43670 RepID=A0A0A0BC33_9CELL|nr:DUF4037 domain-containing protein [Cellulomonas cellasea]KGM03728.1 hypothetical protein Q760_14860 [Cellulomonas cellasea DSM 20118]GEA86934.1 hypothetical protein CCE01nite_08830 [Cellulomonas cellasea]
MHTDALDLARSYWDAVVEPLVQRHRPGLPLAAGRLGGGSDVLGLDDAMSRDHDWGLRLTLLVPREHVDAVRDGLEADLPDTFRGRPTRFATSWDARVRHRVEVADPDDFAGARLSVDVTRAWDVHDWLTLTGQAVLEVTAGPVFVDTAGRLDAVRTRLAWYPDDVWRHVVACDWQRIDQELPFVGRCAERGDDLGSRVVAGRLVRSALHLGFLLERRWAPYPKWTGSVFRGLPRASAAWAALNAALAADDWRAREQALCEALAVLLDVQRGAGLPSPAHATRAFFDRPYRCVDPEVPGALLAEVHDPDVLALPRGVGSVEQWVDDVAVLADGGRRSAVVAGVAGVGPALSDPGSPGPRGA